MLIAFMVLGCGKNDAVFEAFEASKAAALLDPGDPPKSWTPDTRVQLSAELLDQLVQEGLERQGSFTGDLTVPMIQLRPTVDVDDLSIVGSSRCAQCFGIDLELSGKVIWNAGLLGDGEVPFSGTVKFDVELQPERVKHGWKIFAKPRDVRHVQIQVRGWNQSVSNLAEEPLKQWIDDEVVARIKPIPLTTFGNPDLPLRGLTLEPQGAALTVNLLTTVPDPGRLGPTPAPPKKGFAVWVHPQSVMGFAAAEAFRAGPQTYDIVPEPRTLTVDGNDFSLGLRLWRVEGAGWWRDYTAKGKLGVQGRQIELSADDVQETASSEGAELADPLIYLGEGMILTEMEKAMQLSFPRIDAARGGGKIAQAKVNSLRGEAGALRIGGVLELHGEVEGTIRPRGKMKKR